jgi:hypothetical protein
MGATYEKQQAAQLMLSGRIKIRKDMDSISVIFMNQSSNKDKGICIRMAAGSKVESFKELEDLMGLPLNVKVAFVENMMFLRHSDLWSSKAEGGFVEWAIPMVPKYAKIDPDVVISGNVQIRGIVTLDGLARDYRLKGIKSLAGRYILQGTADNPIEIYNPEEVTLSGLRYK